MGIIARTPERKISIRLLVLLALVTSLGPFSLDLYLPSLPALRLELSASERAAHLTVTSCIIGLAMGQLLAGAVTDTVGRRNPLLIGMTTWIVFTIACGLVTSMTTLSGMRFLQGLSAGIGVAVARAILSDLDPEHLAQHMSRMMLVLAAVPILAPAIGGVVLSMTDWRGLFFVLAGVGAIFSVAVAICVPETLPKNKRIPTPRGAARTVFSTYSRLLTSVNFMLPTIVSGAAMAVMFGYIGVSPFLFQEFFGLSPTQYGLLFGANSVALIAGFQLSTVFLRWISVQRLYLYCALTGTAAAITMGVSATVWPPKLAPIVACLAVVLFVAGLVVPLTSAAAIASAQGHAGGASGLMGALQFFLGALLGSLPPALPFGQTAAVPLAALFFLCLLAPLMLARTRTSRRW